MKTDKNCEFITGSSLVNVVIVIGW